MRQPPLEPAAAREIVRARLARRETMFFEQLERSVFPRPASPYTALLRLADCAPQDIQRLLAKEGLEATLTALLDAGVYLSFEEFKRRRPLVRAGREIPLAATSFDAPGPDSGRLDGCTGGSTGPAQRAVLDLDHVRAERPVTLLSNLALGLRGLPAAIWRTPPPAVAGLWSVLGARVEGDRVERWFSPLDRAELRPAVRDLMALHGTLIEARLAGARLPWPRHVPYDRAAEIAEWLARRCAAAGGSVLRAPTSALVRVALAACERSLDLRRCVLYGSGEPSTPAKVQAIEASGARFVSAYYLAEIGAIGMPCADPFEPGEVHFCADALGLIQRRRRAHDEEVPALLYTTLLPSAPKLLLNVESDDTALVEERSCGCPLGALGLRRQLRQITSYGKLTGEGVSCLAADLVPILEEVLPARFGGGPLDYQLAEEEDGDGLTRTILRVHPRVALVDPELAARAIVEALKSTGGLGRFTRALWLQAGTLQVRREPPRQSPSGKHSALLPLRRAGGAPT